MAVITRWSYKRGGRKAGFHCSGTFYGPTVVVLTGFHCILKSRKYCLIDKKTPFSNFRINNCFCQITRLVIIGALFSIQSASFGPIKKQLLDEVFVISGISIGQVEVRSFYQPSRLIEILII